MGPELGRLDPLVGEAREEGEDVGRRHADGRAHLPDRPRPVEGLPEGPLRVREGEGRVGEAAGGARARDGVPEGRTRGEQEGEG